MRDRDYAAWGTVIGKLAALFPHLVAIEIDDFTHDVAPSCRRRLTADHRQGFHCHSQVPRGVGGCVSGSSYVDRIRAIAAEKM